MEPRRTADGAIVELLARQIATSLFVDTEGDLTLALPTLWTAAVLLIRASQLPAIDQHLAYAAFADMAKDAMGHSGVKAS